VVRLPHVGANQRHDPGHWPSGTCTYPLVRQGRRLLAGKCGQMDTLLTYHRTWETGVGHGHEGRRFQPF
jgi:hypothetical protein